MSLIRKILCQRATTAKAIHTSTRFFSTSRCLQQTTKRRQSSWSSSFDKSMIYPGILLILFGSQVVNVMNAKSNLQDMERRYTLKTDKLREIVQRLKDGEAVDVEKEMRLIDMMFERKERKGTGKIKLGSDFDVRDSTDNKAVVLEDLKEEDFMKMLGLTDDGIKSDESQSKAHSTVKKGAVITNADEIQEQMKHQKELISFKVDPETHVIVETPGDYIDAAKETKLSKFL